MPYRSTGITICGTRYDRRQKLIPEQRAEIFHRYMTEDVSQRQLAREYGVSRRLITFIVNPEREKRNRELLNKRKAKGLYKPDRKKHTEIIREYRRYKQKLFKEGKIQLILTENEITGKTERTGTGDYRQSQGDSKNAGGLAAPHGLCRGGRRGR